MALSQEQFDRLKTNLSMRPKPLEVSNTGDSSSYLSRIGEEYKKAGSNIVSGIKTGAADIAEGTAMGGIDGAAQAVKGVARSGLRTVGGVVGAAFAPITEAPVVKDGLEAVGNAIGDTDVMQKVAEVSAKYPEAAKDVQNLVDLLTLGAGKVAEAPLAAGLKAGTKKTVGMAGDLVDGAVDLGVKATGGITKPENIMQRVARINPTEQVKFKDISGETVGEYLTKRKIFGSSEEVATKLVEKFQQSKTMADDALAGLEGTFRPTPVKTVLDELFKKEKIISSPGALSQDFKRVQALQKKFESDGLTMSEINEVKRLFERNVKLDYVKQNLPDGVKRSKTLDSAIREWQVQQAERLGLKNLPELNKETMYSRMLADALGKKLAGSSANSAISLTDWVMLSGGDPLSVAGFVGKNIVTSTKLQSKLAERLSKKAPKKEVKPEYGQRKPDLTDFLTK